MPEVPISHEHCSRVRLAGERSSDAPMLVRGVPAPRNEDLPNILRHGPWLRSLQPDGDVAAIDPAARVHADLAPMYIIGGAEDNVPGRSEVYVWGIADNSKAAGVKEVRVDGLQGRERRLDRCEEVWKATGRGLDWLDEHVMEGSSGSTEK